MDIVADTLSLLTRYNGDEQCKKILYLWIALIKHWYRFAEMATASQLAYNLWKNYINCLVCGIFFIGQMMLNKT